MYNFIQFCQILKAVTDVSGPDVTMPGDNVEDFEKRKSKRVSFAGTKHVK